MLSADRDLEKRKCTGFLFLHSKPSIDRNTSRVEINITGTVAQAVYPNYGPVIGTDKGDFGLHCGRDHI